MQYLMLAYGLIWLVLGFYLFRMGGRLGTVQAEIARIKSRLNDDGGSR